MFGCRLGNPTSNTATFVLVHRGARDIKLTLIMVSNINLTLYLLGSLIISCPRCRTKTKVLKMDVDDVLSHIGDFGPSQKKVYFLVSLAHVYTAFHAFVVLFIGTDPGWRCVPSSSSGLEDASGNVLRDRATMCSYYEKKYCTPEYSTEYTSIVTEVECMMCL